jgi:hypothetical protein
MAFNRKGFLSELNVKCGLKKTYDFQRPAPAEKLNDRFFRCR